MEGYKTPLKEGKTKAMYYFFTQTCQELPKYDEILKKIKIPVAVMWGTHDEFLLWEPQSKDVKTALNISEENIHHLDAKHFIQEEESQLLVQLIREFIK